LVTGKMLDGPPFVDDAPWWAQWRLPMPLGKTSRHDRAKMAMPGHLA
jgi:hypothetical protein